MKRALLLLMVLLAFTACKREEPAPLPQNTAPAAGVNYEKEAALLKDILKNDPKNLQAWIKLGNKSMDAQRFHEAIEAYSKALEIDPKNVNVRVDMGTCYRYSNR